MIAGMTRMTTIIEYLEIVANAVALFYAEWRIIRWGLKNADKICSQEPIDWKYKKLVLNLGLGLDAALLIAILWVSLFHAPLPGIHLP